MTFKDQDVKGINNKYLNMRDLSEACRGSHQKLILFGHFSSFLVFTCGTSSRHALSRDFLELARAALQKQRQLQFRAAFGWEHEGGARLCPGTGFYPLFISNQKGIK